MNAVDKAKKARLQDGVAGDGKISVSEVNAYVKDPTDVRFLGSVALVELRAAVASGKSVSIARLPKAWHRAAASDADQRPEGMSDNETSTQEIGVHLRSIKETRSIQEIEGQRNEGVQATSRWLPAQRIAVIKSRIAESTGEPDNLRVMIKRQSSAPTIDVHSSSMRILYDQKRGLPQFVSYALYSEDQQERPLDVDREGSHFRSCAGAVPPSLWAGSPLDISHHMPAKDASDQIAMDEGHCTENAAGHRKELNRGPWKFLEAEIRRRVSDTQGRAIVFVGNLFIDEHGKPLPEDRIEWVSNKGRAMAVPTHAVKIVLHEGGDGTLQMQAYVVPNRSDVPRKKAAAMPWLQETLTSIERVEQLFGGAEFFSGVPTNVRAKLKKDPNAVFTPPAGKKLDVISKIISERDPRFFAGVVSDVSAGIFAG